jgi:hypothetical protein
MNNSISGTITYDKLNAATISTPSGIPNPSGYISASEFLTTRTAPIPTVIINDSICGKENKTPIIEAPAATAHVIHGM